MGNVDTANAIADKLRSEPWRVLPMKYNCIGKSFRFRSACRKLGIPAKIVFAIISVDNPRFSFLPRTLIGFHAWVGLYGQRIELARPLDELNPWGCYDIDLKRLFAVEV